MIDHLLGRPSSSWKRTQVFLVISFWIWRLIQGSRNGPRALWIRKFNRVLARFTPWQIIVSTLTTLYAIRHLDSILGLGAPEPLARLYSRSYYRSTWIVTGLDAGFATAMSIRPKWLRDICSIIFSVYYIIYANEADEKLRKFRAVCTVEMLRTTWEKMSNPYLRALSALERPSLPVVRQVILPRPSGSVHKKPIIAWLFFAKPEKELANADELILDMPGGGFICMSPLHHEERLRRWAIKTGKPVLSIDYGKAPEYPYPWAIEEGFDAYRVLVESRGREIGMSGKSFNVIMSGDSAGASIVATIMFKILESPTFIQRPLALVFNYPALDFNFTSWMTPRNLNVLRSEQSSGNLYGLENQKDHFNHRSPLSVVPDIGRKPRRKRSWAQGLGGKLSSLAPSRALSTSPAATRRLPRPDVNRARTEADEGELGDDEEVDFYPLEERDKPLSARVRYSDADLVKQNQADLREAIIQATNQAAKAKKTPIGTSLTMTSRTGFFNDRIIAPSMMRAMAILYMGPKRRPDFESDYYISPILAPSALLVQFPRILLTCGEKDPFVDDTVIFAGRIREAKRARKAEILRGMAGRSARFGEDLRMSVGESAANKEQRRLLEETDEDWVDMRIIEGWSHGYLQMPTLLPEVRTTIDQIAEWMDDSFALHREGTESAAATAGRGGERVASNVGRKAKGQGTAIVSDGEMDDVLVFTPKKRASPPPSLAHGSDGRGTLSSSDETQGGPATPPPLLHLPPVVEPGTRSKFPAAGAQPVELVSPGDLELRNGTVIADKGVLRDSPAPVDKAGFLAPLETPVNVRRTSTPAVPAGGFLSEKELLRRRQADAVYGMGDTAASDGEAPTSAEIERESSELW